MSTRRLARARRRFVQPFYLGTLTVDGMRDLTTRAEFLEACSKLDKRTARALLSERDWRGRKTAAWMIGVNRWEEFVPQISRQLVESELVYSGQGYSVGLALISTEEARDGLVTYLERWLPELDCHYDQAWAMGALIEVDNVLATEYLVEGGLWDCWRKAQRGRNVTLAPVGEIVSLLRTESGGATTRRRPAVRPEPGDHHPRFCHALTEGSIEPAVSSRG